MGKNRKLCIISFTDKGRWLSKTIAAKSGEMETELFTKKALRCGDDADKECEREISVNFVEKSVSEWAKEQMDKGNAMLFIGACGIAVRAVAPHLTDKLHDVPVLVMDEKGKYVIPILSGHVGGANAIAAFLAENTGAEPVITTATDINEKFAVDIFAIENGFSIVNKEGIAKVSAKALAGEEITISMEPECEISLRQKLPAGICIKPYPPEEPVDVLITSGEHAGGAALVLRPGGYVIGMGCKKGKRAEEIEGLIMRKIRELGISKNRILALASISQKQNEEGFLAWCRKENIPFLTYTAEELREVERDFGKSAFVEEKVGVDNVCERAAIKACGPGGKLISEKHSENGMTIAVARAEVSSGWGNAAALSRLFEEGGIL